MDTHSRKMCAQVSPLWGRSARAARREGASPQTQLSEIEIAAPRERPLHSKKLSARRFETASAMTS
jgi:hypothetical protein